MTTYARRARWCWPAVAIFGVAVAKLPPAPLMTEEQKAEKAAKDKASADKAKAELTRAEDKAVANYQANQKRRARRPRAGRAGRRVGRRRRRPLAAQLEKASNAHSPPKK